MLADNRYGKSGIRLVKVLRRGDRHEIRDLTVAVELEGDFAAAHESGDNSRVLPTDTMKNTVYALAHDHALDSIEAFGLVLSEHFLRASAAASHARVRIVQHAWEHVALDGVPHPHAFVRAGGERRTTDVTRNRSQVAVRSGLDELTLLKSAGSGFSGFLKDRYTTLGETEDRILATTVRASWEYEGAELAFELLARAVRRTLVETFADHVSASVQHTLHAMGEAVLERHPEVAEIRLTLPNKHHLLVDLSPFGLKNRNEVFVATDEPYGLIEATFRRSGAGGRKARP